MTQPTEPRSVAARIDWFLNNDPGGVGWCMRHTWHALGGDQDPPNPPRWGCPDANCVHDKVRASGRYWDTPPPRGALVLWRYGAHGHAALSLGDGLIATTDPTGRPGGVGVEDIGYPARWGAKGHIWTDTYAGTTFPVGEEGTMLEYWYGGKPDGVFEASRKYKTLDGSIWDPKNKGLQLSLVYLNVSGAKLLPGKPGALRVRMVRADGDKSGYHDYPITGLDTQLITHTYFELGNGKPIFWQVKCVGGLVACTIGTRYTKGSVT